MIVFTDLISELSILEWLLFIFLGVLTGIINTLAGSGSVITIPIFMFLCGLPPTVANGTNRIGVMLQSLVGLIGFKKHKITNFKHVEWMLIPAIIGSFIGTYIATDVSEQTMNYSIGSLMVFILFLLLLNPKKWINNRASKLQNYKSISSIIIYTMIGLYGGYLQAGVGVFLLSALVLFNKHNLMASNGIKMLFILMFNIPALIWFSMQGKVHFGFGICMAISQAIGAILTTKYIYKINNINLIIHRFLVIMITLAIIKFFYKPLLCILS